MMMGFWHPLRQLGRPGYPAQMGCCEALCARWDPADARAFGSARVSRTTGRCVGCEPMVRLDDVVTPCLTRAVPKGAPCRALR